ncbi:cytochrome P450 [Lentiprolixibacter aurantiacus]|uniref:Cytochrome P450 n=1 Tax=Lentiprolixibacter aurantiacus TaxID=2993939 RepID=A0AAE3MJU4_9FLAO|nr:cytochrome P450 [Lentiprolixibacter aurantiacus]MCX2719030.1 cytochrome P450 [Lentiprolixibacter aurantiacus]
MKNLPTISRREVFKNRKRILKNPLPFHRENFERLGDTFRVKVILGPSVVFTRDAGIIAHVLQKNHKNYQKSTLQTRDLARYIGEGILTATGEHWRVHRRMIQPAFHRKKLAGLFGIMKETIARELQRITTEEIIDVFPLMGDLAFQVVARSLFSGSNISHQMNRLQQITEDNQRMLIQEMRQPYLKWWFHLSGRIKRHLKMAEEGRNLLDELIERRISSKEHPDDLLDMLLNSRYEDGSPMPRRQLIDEVLILFTAGHETTANALSFSLYLLARHPEIQDKLYEEVKNIDWEGADLLAELPKLQFTKQCIEEALRLYPPVYVIDRVTVQEDKAGKLIFPRDTLVLLSIFELHRSRKHWEDPEKYNPERFAPERKKDFSKVYYPFGGGPRMCVGNNFAMYEMMITLGLIAKQYRLESPANELELDPLISLKPKKVPILFHPRSSC